MKKCAVLAAVILCAAAAVPACAEEPNLKTVKGVLEYVAQNQPAELDLGEVRMKPAELLAIKAAMGENAVLHFTITWLGVRVSDTDTLLDMSKANGRPSVEDIGMMVQLLPDLQRVDLSKGFRLSSKNMITLIETYPDIQFDWLIILNEGHSLYSYDTAYSTFNDPQQNPVKLYSNQLDILKYAPGLKALDLGHNNLTSLDFLQYFPDLEFLILGDNLMIDDISMIGTLKHLKFLELFSVGVTDISPLANCTELIDLNLSYDTKLTDLSVLDGLTNLERFWGSHMTGMSEEAQAAFIAAHPDTEVKFNASHATSDGWRQHERYTHYIWCLKHHTWIPFDEPLPDQ